MSDQQQAVRDDIAFLRSLAEAGRAGALNGGSIFVACGLIYGAASVASWRLLSGPPVTNALAFPAIWFGATGIFLVCLRILKARMRDASGAPSRAGGLVWATSGWAIFTIVVSLMVISYRTQNWATMTVLPAMILSIYGAAWLLGAILSRLRWVYAVAAGSFVMSVVCAWFSTRYADLYLVFAAALVGLLAAPGWIMLRQSKARA